MPNDVACENEVENDASSGDQIATPDPFANNFWFSPLLMILSDSSLPLGTFAYSSGLESFIAHRRPSHVGPVELHQFLALSLASVSSTTLPYVLAGHRQPQSLLRLDNDLDASTLCQVTRRASIAQGRALVGVWERSLVQSVISTPGNFHSHEALRAFGSELRRSKSMCDFSGPSGHFPPLWGTICCASSIPIATTAYVYLFKHAQSVISAAVRASVIGPYQAQAALASQWLQTEIQSALTADSQTPIEDAGQVVPIMELWVGLHDKLYTKIFSS